MLYEKKENVRRAKRREKRWDLRLSQLLKMGHVYQAPHTPLQCKGYPQSLRADRNSTDNAASLPLQDVVNLSALLHECKQGNNLGADTFLMTVSKETFSYFTWTLKSSHEAAVFSNCNLEVKPRTHRQKAPCFLCNPRTTDLLCWPTSLPGQVAPCVCTLAALERGRGAVSYLRSPT